MQRRTRAMDRNGRREETSEKDLGGAGEEARGDPAGVRGGDGGEGGLAVSEEGAAASSRRLVARTAPGYLVEEGTVLCP